MTKQYARPRLTLASAITADNSAPVNGTAASQILTLVGGQNAVADETVTIKDLVYTWVSALTSGVRQALVGVDGATSIAALLAKINDDSRGPGFPRDPNVVASAGDTAIEASGILTLTGQPLDTETVPIGAKTYTFQTVLTDVDGNVLIGATASDSLDNLIAAIMLGAGAGSTYATSMTLHPTVTAVAGAGDTMDATAKTKGTAGNAIGTTETLTNGSWAAATLLGGLDDTMVITSKTVGTAPNSWATTETMTQGSWGAATLASGVARSGINLRSLLTAGYALPEKWSLMIVITGTGAISCNPYLWGYEDAGDNGNAGEYGKLGTGATRGHLNQGILFDGTTKEVLKSVEVNLGMLNDVYFEVRDILGTSASVNAYLTPIDEVHGR